MTTAALIAMLHTVYSMLLTNSMSMSLHLSSQEQPTPMLSAADFAQFFQDKFSKICDATAAAPPPVLTVPPLSSFEPVFNHEIATLLHNSPSLLGCWSAYHRTWRQSSAIWAICRCNQASFRHNLSKHESCLW